MMITTNVCVCVCVCNYCSKTHSTLGIGLFDEEDVIIGDPHTL